jgi:Cu(I)/Ag(I) efflux system membrane fusion protein
VTQSAPASGEPVYYAAGRVEKVSAVSITISHKPVPALKWPAMTMDFAKPGPNAFPDIRAGQDAEFSFTESKDGFLLENVTSVGGARK